MPRTEKLRYVLVLLGIVVLLPIMAVQIPPLIDYPNHLTRLWLLAGGIHDPTLAHFYAEDWSHIGTNIGIDLAAKLLPIPAFLLGRFLLAAAALLPPFGAIALNAAQFRKLDPWQLVFPYFWCTETFLAGFLNFQIGLGLALLGAAADRFWSTARARHPIRLAIAGALFIVHPYALLFYCGLLAALAFGADFPERSTAAYAARIRKMLPAIAVCLVPLLVFLWTQALPGTPRHHWIVRFNDLAGMLGALASPFTSYSAAVDMLFAYPLVVLVGYAVLNRKVEAHAGLLMLACALAVLAPFMPAATNEGTWLDRRLPIMAVLTVLAATRLSFGPSKRQAATMAIAGLTLVVLRTAWIAWNWSAGAAMLDSTRTALASLPPGATLLTVDHKLVGHDLLFPPRGRILGGRNETFGHFAALAVPWRHAFVPTLFSEAGKQPIRVLPPWNEIADPGGGPELPSVRALRDPRLGPRYMHDWRKRFDYLLALNADRPDRRDALPPGLVRVRDAGFAQLFRIEHHRNDDR